MKTGIADLPLHYGKIPRWLFQRMKELAREIVSVIIYEYDTDEVLRRLSDPFWFQAFGCVLGFDWHSSGLTTTVCGALKEGIKGREKEFGLFIAGGKGNVSRQTPLEIENFTPLLKTNPERLIYASKIAAKVDSSALQDGYQLYHHCFIFTKNGLWAVVQQGMNEETHYARRYHWLSEKVSDFVCEPHFAICCDHRGKVLNMVAKESEKARDSIVKIVNEKPNNILSEIRSLKMPIRHSISIEDIEKSSLKKILLKTYENQPKNFEHLLSLKGIGPKTIRALSLLSELIYKAPPSTRDPVRYSFAHGGKDRHPYPVDKENYDNSINFLKEVLNSAKIGYYEKLKAFRRLSKLNI
jgi:hypothetical protein